MAYEVVFKKSFIVRLENTVTYLEENWGSTVADNFLKRVEAIIDTLKHNLEIGAASKKINGARGIHITKHNRLFYTIDNKTVVILNMYDTRMRDY